jgi:hypothetical protein
VIASVDHEDVVRAKEVLGGHCCILSGAPSSLRLGSLREFEEYYKHLIDTCGKGGGLMLSMGLPKGKKEDLKAMVDSIKEYIYFF